MRPHRLAAYAYPPSTTEPDLGVSALGGARPVVAERGLFSVCCQGGQFGLVCPCSFQLAVQSGYVQLHFLRRERCRVHWAPCVWFGLYISPPVARPALAVVVWQGQVPRCLLALRVCFSFPTFEVACKRVCECPSCSSFGLAHQCERRSEQLCVLDSLDSVCVSFPLLRLHVGV